MALKSLTSMPSSSLSIKFKNSNANDSTFSHPTKSISFLNPIPLFSSISFKNASQVSPSVTVKASAASSSPPTTVHQELKIKTVPTQPFEGQKTGTSGLRKKVKVFMQENYLANWIQALFDSLPPEDYKNGVLVLGVMIIIKIAAGNGVGKVLVGMDGIMSTPAVSAVIRKRKANGGFIMSASHNPGGPDYDWGIKISEIKVGDIPDVDLSRPGLVDYGAFSRSSRSSSRLFGAYGGEQPDINFSRVVTGKLSLLSRSDFRFIFDAMHAVTGAYAKPIFVDKLGASPDSISNGVPLEDFGHGHPDPNLTYAKDLVDILYGDNGPDFGAASDGDGDRNMILGRAFFVTPSDSVAIIAANAQETIPYFKTGPKGLARSMPTSGALDRVAEKLNLPFYEVPTGWKFFGNLMDEGKLSICGEESFGTGSDHIREKDGIWAVLAWLSIIAYRNKDKKLGEKLVSVSDVVNEHWATYGRNFFSRYDYEASFANFQFFVSPSRVRFVLPRQYQFLKFGLVAPNQSHMIFYYTYPINGSYTLQFADDFNYTDPVDGSVVSKQGVRFVFTDGSRIIFRLSGTGSAGATVRVYIEQFEPDASKHDVDAQTALKPLIALSTSKLKEFTGREQPTVIT
ncbi:UNVERIFIED_CONTAM: Phosphoglucomutase, chloroplastic [Sesamum angustifolium]|uniref:phosphoglucomutase (alpha-D-glucose-1,6-bisphosphate-dependent) n=1 Tax=Sesamum angustifolium TaxID=2727405 RepID=A0AAW2PV30_9LAMI